MRSPHDEIFCMAQFGSIQSYDVILTILWTDSYMYSVLRTYDAHERAIHPGVKAYGANRKKMKSKITIPHTIFTMRSAGLIYTARAILTAAIKVYLWALGLCFMFRFVSTCLRPVSDSYIYSSPAVSGRNCSKFPTESSRLPHSSFFQSIVGDFTMSKSYQNLLFAFLFLLGHLLIPTMSSQLVSGASCPKGKVMVCCYGAPFVCYAWDWPCEDHELEQCCKKTDVCTILLSALFRNEIENGMIVRQAKCGANFRYCDDLRSSRKKKVTGWLEFITDSYIECRCWCLWRMSGPPYRTRDATRASSWLTGAKTRSGFQHRVRRWYIPASAYTRSSSINLDGLDCTHSYSAMEGRVAPVLLRWLCYPIVSISPAPASSTWGPCLCLSLSPAKESTHPR